MRNHEFSIVFLLRYWPVYGGGETVTRILANKLTELGHNVEVFYLWEKTRADMPFINQNIKQHKISGVSPPYGEDGIKKSDYKIITGYLCKYFEESDVDIVIDQWISAKIVYNAIKGTRIKLICPHHSAVYIDPVITTVKNRVFYAVFGLWGKHFAIWRRLYPAYKYADKFIVLAQAYLNDCKKLFKTKNQNKKITVINNPLAFEDFIDDEGINKKQKEVLFVGRIYEPVKRITYILDAWKMLQEKGKTREWKLYIVGDGPDLDMLRSYADCSALQGISFTGSQNPLEYYRRGSIFLMTSSFEGWGMTLVEAQQNGCVPVVMDSFQSLHEIIQRGTNGLIVPNNDIPALAEAVERLMDDDKLRLKLAYKGMETCGRFSIDVIIQQWETLFHEIM
jgi:glycosyltransferase involved in cell wall biosynthesis